MKDGSRNDQKLIIDKILYTKGRSNEFFVPNLFEEKQRDIVFSFPSFRMYILPSPILVHVHVCTLCAQLLQSYSDTFET